MRKTPIRTNVLVLVSLGYGTLLLMFGAMAWGGMTVEEAYEVVKGPLMALIGGSLAISKDLLDNPSSASKDTPNSQRSEEEQNGDSETKLDK